MHDLDVENDFESSFLVFVDEHFMNDDNDEFALSIVNTKEDDNGFRSLPKITVNI